MQCSKYSVLQLPHATAMQVVSAPAAMAIPAPEAKSFGAERTAKLIEESGTPGAARPGTHCVGNVGRGGRTTRLFSHVHGTVHCFEAGAMMQVPACMPARRLGAGMLQVTHSQNG
jgi:hypothetical protein